jgi:phage terminase small subunit
MSNTPELTDRQARFVTNFLVTGNGTKSAIEAGFSPASARVTAHRLLTKAAVRAAIAARQGVDARRLEIERQDVIQGLLEGVAAARSQANPAAMIAGWREIGKMLGFFAPQEHRVELRGDSHQVRRLSTMSNSDLESLIDGRNPSPSL